MDILSQLIEQIRTQNWIDWTVTITALIYVLLAARENIWCWFWGIISCSLWAYASFAFYHLWMDALLQLFYVAMAIVGWYQWRRGESEGEIRTTTHLTAGEHILYTAILFPTTFLFGYFFSEYTEAAATYPDAFTTILSIIATLVLVQKKLETWLYWVLADALYVWLYARQGAYLFSLLMIIYVIIAADAYFRWKKQMKSEAAMQGE
ncbi:MAG: nicotinamide riboside transporter PnuC [Saprospiraceae bacterium]|nr:nicotinamide mononucleotide transporter [Lewinella sp.]